MSGIGRVDAIAAPVYASNPVAYGPPLFWRGAPRLAIAMIAIVVARLPELVPVIGKLRPGLIGSAVLALVLLMRSNGATWHWLWHRSTTRVLFAWVGWAALMIPFALWAGLAFETVRNLLPLLAMYVAIIMCRPKWATVDRLQRGCVIALAAFAVVSIAKGQLIAGRLRPLGDTYDPNDMAAVMAVGVMLALGAAARAGLARRIIMYGATLILVAAILATASRGGTLALAVGGVVLAAAQPGVRRLVYGIALLLGAVIAWQAGGSVFRDRVRSITDLETDYNLSDRMGRIEVWKRSAEHFADHPLTGVGAGNFAVAEGAWLEARGERGKWSAAHNAYIQAFTDLGIVGGLLFLWLIGTAVWQARRLWRSSLARAAPEWYRPELLAALCTFCVAAIYLSLAYSGMLICLLGLITLASNAAAAEAEAA